MTDLATAARADVGLLPGLALFAILAILGCLAIVAAQGHRQTLLFQCALFLTAFALRFVASLALYRGHLIEVVGTGDDVLWTVGAILHDAWIREGRSNLDLPRLFAESYRTHHDGYYYLLGVLFHFTPPAQLTAAALNGFLGALAVVLVYRTARIIASERAAANAGLLTCAFPSLILWSALTIKEPVVLFLSVLAVHCAVRVRASGLTLRHLAALAASIALLVPFRFYAAYVTTAAVLLGMILPRFDRRPMARGALAGGVLLAVSLFVSGILALRGPTVEAKFEDPSLANIQRFRAITGQRGGSGVPVHDDVRTVRGFTAALAVGGVHLLLAPLPWQTGAGGLRVYLTFPEMVVWWCLLPTAIVPGLVRMVRTRFDDVLPILIFVAGLGMAYSLLFSNIGLIFRQRSQLLPWFFVFAGVGIDSWLQARTDRKRGGAGRERMEFNPVGDDGQTHVGSPH